MKTLSIQRPRPSIETRTAASISTPAKAARVNWLPWTPFCLSSGDSSGVDFLAALRDAREDLSGEVTLQGSNDVKLRVPFGYSTCDIVFGSLVGAQATNGADVQRAIGGTISSPVEPMPDGLSGRRRNRADAA